ncbi:hypothetical protein GON03_20425 [Nocardioides sp. MAH-18]|uniref:Uncharacterized protein n=1 Tax=Nocardioides agri TaxID=2682843 RepID=A0A6L6XVY7_9ACTN|nr:MULTISPECIES: hypothetical protein [unclassified Nocardioides]MBA2952390.1 hypothetical protein [Nocardioides sp. CGMCC 1.13656]MVQ51551.1 hypothetical protein [Nocardioides sp. MAH-18]
MSKMDALRAMREARYAEATERAARAKTTPQTAPRSRPPVAPPEAAAPAPEPAAAPDGRCGHRSMNGRTCTRESGHAAKSHRYS